MLAVTQGPSPTPAQARLRRRTSALLLSLLALALVGAAVLALSLERSGGDTIGPYSAQVTWPAVRGAKTVRLYLNGQLVDRVASSTNGTYELHGLWPATTFRVDVQLVGRHDQVLVHYRHRLTTKRAVGPFPRLYSPTAFINRPIPTSPSLDPSSAAIIAYAIKSGVPRAHFSNNEDWGIPIVTAEVHSERSKVGCTLYGCFLGVGAVHIPANAQPSGGSDHHLVVLQPNGNELDMWVGVHTDGGWTAAARWSESATGPASNCPSGGPCGADAANFALGAGVVRPEEISQGHIDHALAITTPYTRRGYVACPATHGDGRDGDPRALPIGAHLQLDPTLDVASLPIPRWQKVIALALQRYGAYVEDTGGSVAIYAQSNLGRGYDAWAKAGVPSSSPSLAGFPWASMRVLSMTRCPS